MSPGERRKMVSKDVDLSLSLKCKVLNISRSGLYYTPVGMGAQTLALMH
jgi:putative transposase